MSKLLLIQFNEIKYSGAEILFYNLLPSLLSEFDQVHLLSTGRNVGNFSEAISLKKVKIYHFNIVSISFPLKYIKYLLENKPSVVHINRETFYIYFSLITRLFSKAKIFRSFHAVYIYRGKRFGPKFKNFWILNKRVSRICASNILKIKGISASQTIYENERHNFYNNTIVLANAIDDKKFAPVDLKTKMILREQLNLSEEKFYFILVGSCLSVKRHDIVLRALAKLVSEYNLKNVELIHLGNGPLLKKEFELANNLDIVDKVHFLNEVINVNEYLKASDCYIMPSEMEGQGLSLVEALASGLPAALTDIITFRQFKCTESIYYFNMNDLNKLVEQLYTIYIQNDKIQTSAVKYSEYIRENYSLDRYFLKLLDIYNS